MSERYHADSVQVSFAGMTFTGLFGGSEFDNAPPETLRTHVDTLREVRAIDFCEEDSEGFHAMPPVNDVHMRQYKHVDFLFTLSNIKVVLEAHGPLSFHALCDALLHSQREVSYALGAFISVGAIKVSYVKRPGTRQVREVEDMIFAWIGAGAPLKSLTYYAEQV